MPRVASSYTAIDNADVIIETIDNRECFYLQKIAWFDNLLKLKLCMHPAYIKRVVRYKGWLGAASFADSRFRRSNVDWRYLATHYASDLAEYRSNR